MQVKQLKILMLLIAMLCGFDCGAQTTFRFSAGTVEDGGLKDKMESNITALLTEINRAASSQSTLDLSRIDMEPVAKERLVALWEDARFVCDKSSNISKCLKDFQGYQVRGIPVTIEPADSTYNGPTDRELTISLNKKGVITGVRPGLELQKDVNKIMSATGTGGIAEARMRRELLKWVEDFRSYYDEKNLDAIEKVYSDGGLILTGSKVYQKKYTDDGASKVNYFEQYLANLKRLFAKEKNIDVDFEYISVMKHGGRPNIYGLTLHQKWRTNMYQDDGWLFMLWDFNDPESPVIHVRTWQPDEVAAKDGVFTLDDFFIP